MKYFCKKMKRKGIRYLAFTGLLAAGCLLGCGRKEDITLESMDTAMGTVIQQRIYLSEGQDTQLTQRILEQIRDLEAEVLSWRLEEAELAQVNAQQGCVEVSQELLHLLEPVFEVAEASGGAFDPTIGEVVRLWNIDEWAQMENPRGYRLPPEDTLSEALAHTGYEKLSLDVNASKLYLPEGMQLDLGAVGKGIALNRIRELLEGEAGGAVISAGGSILTFGERPDHAPWRIGITDPLKYSDRIGYLEISGRWCISTSGDYERYVEVDGVRYHHIIDPDTGYPADSGVRGVTILAKDGLLSDALSTACFVLGVEEGMELAERFEAEALFVTEEGTIEMTTGMETYFHTR